jgi:myo-inositol-1(or 4)-monophosphatase
VTEPYDGAELAEVAGIAAEILDAAEPFFSAALGASATVHKGPGDFATEADLVLEEKIVAALRESTGVDVHGEEGGGPALDNGTLWVLDPIDGTANYSRGLPMTGINLALIREGEPVVGLTWLPLLDERYVAVAGGPVRRNGVELPPLASAALRDVVVAPGYPISQSDPDHGFGTGYRMAVLREFGERCLRVRVFGSSALDYGWVAAGVIGAAISFGNHPWDTAPGACLVRAAGGEVYDLSGRPHTLRSRSMIAVGPGIAAEALEILAAIGEPSAYGPD